MVRLKALLIRANYKFYNEARNNNYIDFARGWEQQSLKREPKRRKIFWIGWKNVAGHNQQRLKWLRKVNDQLCKALEVWDQNKKSTLQYRYTSPVNFCNNDKINKAWTTTSTAELGSAHTSPFVMACKLCSLFSDICALLMILIMNRKLVGRENRSLVNCLTREFIDIPTGELEMIISKHCTSNCTKFHSHFKRYITSSEIPQIFFFFFWKKALWNRILYLLQASFQTFNSD